MPLPAYPGALRAPEDFRAAPGEPEHATELDDYADLADMLDAADEAGVLDVPAEDAEAARAGRANLVRESVIAERLWLLGYLESRKDLASSRRRRRRERFLAAVAAFQRGAGLVADRWSGDETWQALQRLVTFESATHVADYCRDGEPMPALVRALRLRLWALGFEPRKPASRAESETLPEKALGRFWKMWGRFNPGAFGKRPPPVPELIDLVFDEDRLLERVAKANKKRKIGRRERLVFTYHKLTSEKREVTDPEVESFLACLAKIELWLLGFEVDITHNRNYPVYLFRASVSTRNAKLGKALDEFWRRLAREHSGSDRASTAAERRRRRADAARLREFITPELFIALDEPDALTTVAQGETPRREPFSEGECSREVARRIDAPERIEAAWEQGKRLGMKLWDGVRRLWRWIRRGIMKLLEIGRNLVRAFFRYSLKAFEIAKLTVRTTAEALLNYADGDILEDSAVRLVLAKDGDIRMLVPSATAPSEIVSAARALRYFGASFVLACRILAAIVRALRSVATGALGWARLLWLLVHSYREMRPLYKAMLGLPTPAAR